MSAGLIDERIKDGIGVSSLGLMVGSTVFGFFADGNDCQIPIILGSLAGLSGSDEKSELPKSSIGENSAGALKNSKRILAQSPFPGEPESPYAAKYPYNKTIRTESGHLIEIDDTPSKERIHLMHKNGTYVEMDVNGDVVMKTTRNKYDITTSNNNVYIGGDANIKVNGNLNMLVDGTYTVESKGDMLFKAPRIDFNP
jgi:hypothetical protein